MLGETGASEGIGQSFPHDRFVRQGFDGGDAGTGVVWIEQTARRALVNHVNDGTSEFASSGQHVGDLIDCSCDTAEW